MTITCLRIHWQRAFFLSAAIMLAACSSSSTANHDGQAGGGGGGTAATNLGGSTAAVDAAVTGTGGSSTNAGGSTASTGGSTASSGGTTGVGGTTSLGGTASAGGTTNTGGTTSRGGTTSAGGTTSSGGTSRTGGSSATGGSAGGATSSGGSGGVAGSGGSSGTRPSGGSGGATVSGGTVSSSPSIQLIGNKIYDTAGTPVIARGPEDVAAGVDQTLDVDQASAMGANAMRMLLTLDAANGMTQAGFDTLLGEAVVHHMLVWVSLFTWDSAHNNVINSALGGGNFYSLSSPTSTACSSATPGSCYLAVWSRQWLKDLMSKYRRMDSRARSH